MALLESSAALLAHRAALLESLAALKSLAALLVRLAALESFVALLVRLVVLVESSAAQRVLLPEVVAESLVVQLGLNQQVD